MVRWRGRRQSTNIDDRRGRRARRVGAPMAMGGGLGTLLIIVVIVLMGGDPRALLENMPDAAPPAGQVGNGGPAAGANDELKQYVAVILADTEDVWGKLFRQSGRQYVRPELVLFTGEVRSACGFASSASGPFYCPGDSKVYIDLAFYDELARRFGAPGDFAQAYVLAHEVGHHVQHLLGITDRVDAQRGRVSEEEYNRLSVRLELQADFFAGVWAHHAQQMKNILEPGDIEEGLRAASAIGDDRLQMKARGYVVPDSFTHGTSEQRVRWFRLGLETGDMSQGNTFAVENL